METIGGYEIIGELGRGGSGTVYLARQQSLGRRVALKLLSTDDAELGERLLNEARLLADLHHPNIISVIDVGTHHGQPWYSMTYCGGGTLAAVLRRDGQLSDAQTVGVVATVADALDALHRRGMVHRDVKPGNVLLGDDGTVYLGDLGTALDAKAERVTTSGAVLGTVGYTAPEMISGDAPTPAADTFSLGVLAYECLAGQRPFAGSNIIAVIDAIRAGRYTSLAQAAPRADRQVTNLIESALRGEPAHRPSDLRVWADQLRAAKKSAPLVPFATEADAGPTVGVVSSRLRLAPPVPAAEPPQRRRRGAAVWLTAAAVFAALGIGWAAFGSGGDASSAGAATDSLAGTSDSGAAPTDAASTSMAGTDITTTSLAPGDTAPPAGTTTTVVGAPVVPGVPGATVPPPANSGGGTPTTQAAGPGTTAKPITTTTVKPTGSTNSVPTPPVTPAPTPPPTPAPTPAPTPPPPPPNPPPVAGPNTMGFTFATGAATTQQKCNTISVFGNDFDPDGGPISAEATGANFSNNSPNGSYYTLASNGTFTVCATRGAANSFNALVVNYRVRDDEGQYSSVTSITISLTLT